MGFWNILEVAGWPLLHLAATQTGVCGVRFTENTGRFLLEQAERTGEEIWERGGGEWLAAGTAQLREYLHKGRRRFELPVDLRGTAFQRQVWEALRQIPYGGTRSYGEVAKAAGRPKAVRAVGAACAANPVAIVVPCHRVVAQGGKLGGYSGGVKLKRRLLELEAGPAKDAADEV